MPNYEQLLLHCHQMDIAISGARTYRVLYPICLNPISSSENLQAAIVDDESL